MTSLQFSPANEVAVHARALAAVLRGTTSEGLYECQKPDVRPMHPLLDVLGVGVVLEPGQEALKPLVLLDGGSNVGVVEWLRVPDIPHLRDFLSDALPHTKPHWEKGVAIYVPTPETRTRSGDKVTALLPGTIGGKAQWGSSALSMDGMMTAGHVVQSQTTVTVGGQTGTVVFESDFINSGNVAMPDLAVIDFGRGVASSSANCAAAASGMDRLDLLLHSGVQPVTVIGRLIDLAFPKDNGTAGTLYMTVPGVTTGGDSGAAAVLSSHKTDIVGHVIGGSTTFADYIQDIHYQLTAARRRLPNIAI